MDQASLSSFSIRFKRFIAFVIDSLLWIFMFIVLSPMLLSRTIPGSQLYLYVLIVGFLVPFLYSTLFNLLFGATVGKLCLGLRVISIGDSKKPTIAIAAYRAILSIVSTFSFGLAFIWILIDSRSQGFTDKLAKTVVLSKKDIDKAIPEPSDVDRTKWNFGRIILALSATFLVVLISLIFYKPTLNEDAVTALIDYSLEEDPEQNGYYAVSAFGIAESLDPHTAGLKRTIETNSKIISILEGDIDYIQEQMLSGKLNAERDSLDYRFNELVPDDGESYTDLALEKSNLINELISKYDYLLPRYKSLADYKVIENKILPDMLTPVPILMNIVNYHRLFCYNLTLEYIHGDKATAVESLKLSEAVCVNLLEKADYLMLKLAAMVMMGIHQSALNDIMIYEDRLNPELYEYIIGIEDLSTEAMSLRKPLYQEYNYSVAYALRMINSGEVLKDCRITKEEILAANPPLLKGNSFVNNAYQNVAYIADFSELTTSEMNERFNVLKRPSTPFLEYLHNPIGVIIEKVTIAPVYTEYALQLRDLHVRNQLLKMGAVIKSTSTPEDKVVEVIKANSDKYNNPYNGKPFFWFKDSKAIKCIGPDMFKHDGLKVKLFR